ncbi:MAG: hypothetical protein ONB11_09310 [candidate division KSB1 bacterium]|nr:hypothetical protein [candidate division KSB1 bacterium]MDZ7342214.1 hypothetical protein [candidate division KSB1 bacterium]
MAKKYQGSRFAIALGIYDAPNNIIHVRLATGSGVDQMSAHLFTKLHTALTHNGEATNYEALQQRVEQNRSKK